MSYGIWGVSRGEDIFTTGCCVSGELESIINGGTLQTMGHSFWLQALFKPYCMSSRYDWLWGLPSMLRHISTENTQQLKRGRPNKLQRLHPCVKCNWALDVDTSCIPSRYQSGTKMKQFSFFCLCLILVAAVIDGEYKRYSLYFDMIQIFLW